MGRDCMCGWMGGGMRGSGRRIRLMGRVSLASQMVVFILELMWMGRSRDMANLSGLTDAHTKVAGKTGNNMVAVAIRPL